MSHKIPLALYFRHGILWLFIIAGFIFLSHRLAILQVVDNEFLKKHGDSISIRQLELLNPRKVLLDRNHKPLAVSSKVQSIWLNPQEFSIENNSVKLKKLCNILGLSEQKLLEKLKTRIQSYPNSQFMYVKRHIAPFQATKILNLKIEGVYAHPEYRRFYPLGEIAAHVIGTTNIDDIGNQGLELAYNDLLLTKATHTTVLKDRLGHKIEAINKTAPNNTKAQDLVLSIDSKLQFIAYKNLIEAVRKHKAQSGSLVMLKVKTGEVLAMVNYPAFNPNQRITQITSNMRNLALTDLIEPGSLIKPFSMASVLRNNPNLNLDTKINTAPGWLKLNNNLIKDVKNFGSLTVPQIIQKSSNIGIAKLILELPNDSIYQTFRDFGFGQPSYSNFPGEVSGKLPSKVSKNDFVRATLSFGYGLNATALQMVHSYSILANHGLDPGVSFLKLGDDEYYPKTQVIEPSIANAVNDMLHLATKPGGTATRAKVAGYQVAGKTGTVRKVGDTGYLDNSHIAMFAGFAPLADPEFAICVIIDDPKSGGYYGGQVAAPVFSKVMSQALKVYKIPKNN